MRIFKLTFINIKRQIKNPLMIVMGIVMPIILLLSIHSDMLGGSVQTMAVFSNDNSKEAKMLIDNMKENFNIKDYVDGNIEEGMEEVKDGKISTLFVIDEDYGKDLRNGIMPNITAYRATGGVGYLKTDNSIESFIKENINNKEIRDNEKNYIKTEVLRDETDKKNSMAMAVIMICYCMMISGSSIVEELLKFKKEQVLRRAVASPSRDIEVIGSLLLSSFIIQGGLAIIAFNIVQTILKFEGVNIGLVILTIFLGSLISNSIILAVVRWVKNESIASLVTVLTGLILFILGMLASNISMIENPPAFFKVGIISPFTWMMRIVEGDGVIIPMIVILLMVLVFATLGSFKIREFAKE